MPWGAPDSTSSWEWKQWDITCTSGAHSRSATVPLLGTPLKQVHRKQSGDRREDQHIPLGTSVARSGRCGVSLVGPGSSQLERETPGKEAGQWDIAKSLGFELERLQGTSREQRVRENLLYAGFQKDPSCGRPDRETSKPAVAGGGAKDFKEANGGGAW